jgi:hypothetical protein
MGYECIDRLSLRSVSCSKLEKVTDVWGCPNRSSEMTSWYPKVYLLASMNIDRRGELYNGVSLWL